MSFLPFSLFVWQIYSNILICLKFNQKLFSKILVNQRGCLDQFYPHLYCQSSLGSLQQEATLKECFCSLSTLGRCLAAMHCLSLTVSLNYLYRQGRGAFEGKKPFFPRTRHYLIPTLLIVNLRHIIQPYFSFSFVGRVCGYVKDDGLNCNSATKTKEFGC